MCLEGTYKESDDDLLSQANAYYHWRGSVSPSCSGWEGVVPLCYGRQTKGWESGFVVLTPHSDCLGCCRSFDLSRLLYVTLAEAGVLEEGLGLKPSLIRGTELEEVLCSYGFDCTGESLWPLKVIGSSRTGN